MVLEVHREEWEERGDREAEGEEQAADREVVSDPRAGHGRSR